MKTRVCGLMSVLHLIVLVKLVYGEVQQQEEVKVTLFNDVMCGIESVSDSVLGVRQTICLVNGAESFPVVGVIEGNNDSFQKALKMVYKNRDDIILKYGVHGFPTLFLMNSTMLVRYQGTRSLRSLVAFYSDVTGIRTAAHESTWISETNQEKQSHSEQESYTFNWTRFPANMFGQDTWLALATGFVLLRLVYLMYPSLCEFAKYIWSGVGHIQNANLGSLWGHHPQAYLARAIQLLNSLKEPCKKSNLQEGAMNARAWASKSLASVSIGEASTTRAAPVREHC